MPDQSASDKTAASTEFLQQLEVNFIVHELKAPLAVIEAGLRGMLERQDAYGPLTDRQEQTVRRMLRSTLRGRSMIDDLMEIGRAEAGRVAKESFRPAMVIHETLLDALETVDTGVLDGIDGGAAPDEVRARLAERGIRLEIDPAVEPAEVFQDEKKFRQILGNLIKNALRFRNERLHVRFFKNGQELIVEVSDDGPGIAREHHELIFEPYAQVGAAHPAGRKGHGLGLAGAQTLARRLGGNITVVSEKGEGSVFKLTVPVTGTDDR